MLLLLCLFITNTYYRYYSNFCGSFVYTDNFNSIQIISTPPIVFGVGNGETSNYCNQDPSKAEYAYEPLEGGLAIPHYRQGDSR